MSTPEHPDLYAARSTETAAKFGADLFGETPRVNWICARCGTGRQYLDPCCGKCRSKKVKAAK